MSNQKDTYKRLYETYSDEEIIRLYTSGDLTKEAEQVALHEIKLRKLTV